MMPSFGRLRRYDERQPCGSTPTPFKREGYGLAGGLPQSRRFSPALDGAFIRAEHLTLWCEVVAGTMSVVEADPPPKPAMKKPKMKKARSVTSAMRRAYAASSIRSRSARAPALSSGSFRLPHFGLCTHEGHPWSQGQPSSSLAVSAAQPSKA